MSFEFEGVNQFSAEVEQDSAVQPQQPPANSVAEELNDTELDAIAGGMRIITASGPKPDFMRRGLSMQITEAFLSHWGQKK